MSTLEYYETKEIIALGATTAFVCWRSTTNEPPAVSATMILWAQILSLVVIATTSGATQWTVRRLGFQPQLGTTAKRRATRFWSAPSCTCLTPESTRHWPVLPIFSQVPARRNLGGVNLALDAIWPAEPGARG